jgi:ACS family hexuronate transporter-like MFS transporter
MAAILFLATALNYLDRQVLSVTAPVLRRDLGMDAVAYSRIVFCFLLAYTIMQAIAGKALDHTGAKLGLAVSMIWWSAALMLHAAARSMVQLGVFRFLLGVGEAGNWPASVKAVRNAFPVEERALAVGFFNSGSAVGAVGAPPLIAWLTLQFSWRAAFAVTGALGFLWLIPWLFLGPSAGPQEAGEPDTGGRTWRSLLRERAVWGLLLARFFCDSVWWFYVFWFPDYLSRARGFSLAMIGATAWLPFLSAGLGNLCGGWLSGRLLSSGRDAVTARKQVMAASALVMAAGVTAVFTPTAFAAIAIVSVTTFAYSCWATNVLTLPSDLLPAGAIASVVGLTGTAAGAGGMLSTLAVGWTVEHFSYSAVFAGAAVAPLCAAGFLWRLVPGSSRSAAALR